MSDFRPSAALADGLLTVHLGEGPEARQVDFDGVIDQTDLGDVVGIEILDLRQQLGGPGAPPPPPDGLPRWSYDDEIDAFYLHVADGPAQVQKVGTGIAKISGDGVLTAVELRVAP